MSSDDKPTGDVVEVARGALRRLQDTVSDATGQYLMAAEYAVIVEDVAAAFDARDREWHKAIARACGRTKGRPHLVAALGSEVRALLGTDGADTQHKGADDEH